jgi:hypothetical protein
MNMRTLAAAACVLISVPLAVAGEPPPPWLRVGSHTVYDGVSDDLVTGGLGADAMLGKRPGYAAPPSFAARRCSSRAAPGRDLDGCSGRTSTRRLARNFRVRARS